MANVMIKIPNVWKKPTGVAAAAVVADAVHVVQDVVEEPGAAATKKMRSVGNCTSLTQVDVNWWFMVTKLFVAVNTRRTGWTEKEYHFIYEWCVCDSHEC